jgi:hypothetical protein
VGFRVLTDDPDDVCVDKPEIEQRRRYVPLLACLHPRAKRPDIDHFNI